MGIIENAKDLAELIKKAGDVELYRRIVELEGEVIELTHENRSIKEELRQRGEQGEIQRSLEHDGEKYWRNHDGKKDGPFCATCWDVDSKLVRMRSYHDVRDRLRHVCEYCRHRSSGYTKSRSGD